MRVIFLNIFLGHFFDLNDNSIAIKATSKKPALKPNLTQQFLRISRIYSKQRSENLFKSSNNLSADRCGPNHSNSRR